MASAIARAYNGGLGAEPAAVSRGRAHSFPPLVRGSGEQSPPEAEAFLVFWTFSGSRKSAHFSKNVKRKEMKYLCYLCKKSWVAMKLRAPGAKLGACVWGSRGRSPLKLEHSC